MNTSPPQVCPVCSELLLLNQNEMISWATPSWLQGSSNQFPCMPGAWRGGICAPQPSSAAARSPWRRRVWEEMRNATVRWECPSPPTAIISTEVAPPRGQQLQLPSSLPCRGRKVAEQSQSLACQEIRVKNGCWSGGERWLLLPLSLSLSLSPS